MTWRSPSYLFSRRGFKSSDHELHACGFKCHGTVIVELVSWSWAKKRAEPQIRQENHCIFMCKLIALKWKKGDVEKRCNDVGGTIYYHEYVFAPFAPVLGNPRQATKRITNRLHVARRPRICISYVVQFLATDRPTQNPLLLVVVLKTVYMQPKNKQELTLKLSIVLDAFHSPCTLVFLLNDLYSANCG